MLVDIKHTLGKRKWSIVFFLWSIHGLVAVCQFTGNSFKPSLPYFTVCFLLLVWVLFNFTLVILDSKNSPWWLKSKGILGRPKVRDFVFFISSLLLLVRIGLWYFRSLFGRELFLRFGGYLDILNPVLDLIAYISLEVIFLVVLYNLKQTLEDKINLQGFVLRLLVLFSFFCLFVIVISKTGLGIASSYRGDWQRGLPAVPLLEWQIILASLLCLGILIFEAKKRIFNFQRLDFLICILIWAGTSAFWLSQPVIPSASALAPHEPNFEKYPFIDSQTYDELAQSVLIGNGFGGEQIPQRPLYIEFLALAHLLAGQDYNRMVFVQTLFFAFFPVLLFILGRDLMGRPVGVSIALLAALRDYTSNLVSPFTGNLSYSKLYLSEIPTAMLLILFLIVGIRWLRSNFPIYLSVLLGGILGVAMLIRTQAIVVVPLMIFFSVLIRPENIRILMKSMTVMSVCTALVVAPWLWRNWQVSGGLVFDNPESQTMNLALRYSRVNGVDGQVARLPGETSVEFSDRLKKIAWDAILSNPKGASWALVNSFVNHGVNNILLFPIRDQIIKLGDLINPSDAFWEKWEGKPTSSQEILLGLYGFLFCLGLTTVWWRAGWLGLLPLGLNLIYNLWTSIALLSGQRFMLTMDWSIYFYYMAGIFTLIGSFLFMLNGGRDLTVDWARNNPFVLNIPSVDVGWKRLLFTTMLFLGIGLSLPFVEHIFPEKYPYLPQGQLVAALSESSSLENSSVNSACLQKLTADGKLNLVQGMALYPRYYSAGDGEDFTDTPGYKVVDKGRLVFDIIGQENHRVIFPLSQSPDFFPNASDVTLIYNHSGDLWFIYVKLGDSERFYVSDEFDRSLCGQ